MNIRNMDLNLLLVFESIYKHRSVSVAAFSLNLSQPAISHALKKLRHSLNDDLFIRTPNGMAPTDKAIAIEKPISRILNEIQYELFEKESFDPLLSDKRFNICSSDHEIVTLLANSVGEIGEKFPNINFNFRLPQAESFYQQLESGKMDLGFAVEPPRRKQFIYHPYKDQNYVCLTRDSDHFKSKKLSLKKFCESNHILVSPLGRGGGGIVDKVLREKGLKRNITVTTQNFSTVPFFLLERDLIYTAPSDFAKKLSKIFPFKVFTPPLKLPGFKMEMVWHKRFDSTEEHKWLRNTLLETI